MRRNMFFHGEDWRVPRQMHPPAPKTTPFAVFHWLTVPDVISWTIDSGILIAERPYLTLDHGNAFAHEVAPLAETLLANLLPVPGTDTRDWSAESASAALDNQAACTRYQHPPRGRRPELVNMHEAVDAHPDLVRPAWAQRTERELDAVADYLNRFGLRHNPRIAEALGFDPQTPRASLVGTRAWLYENCRNDLTRTAPQAP
ncbi:hypothetical protein [Streptomyces sp. NPDC001530]|uniref:hypothetical protein n=1 Tax=Streptomyces sp. NPDC001530 TaxID=3364582 RepID=UPI003675276C